MKSKTKRNPEQELYNRWIIKVILYTTAVIFFSLVGWFLLNVLLGMFKTIIVAGIMIFELDQFQGIQDVVTLFIALAMGSLAVAGILQYDEYNEERISELETIIGSEGSTNED